MTKTQIQALYYGAFIAASKGQTHFALTLWTMAETNKLEDDNNRRACLTYHGGLFS